MHGSLAQFYQRYCCYFITRRYQWFLRLDDDAYVKISELRKFLSKLDASRLLYIGSPAFGLHEGDFVRPGENYCMVRDR